MTSSITVGCVVSLWRGQPSGVGSHSTDAAARLFDHCHEHVSWIPLPLSPSASQNERRVRSPPLRGAKVHRAIGGGQYIPEACDDMATMPSRYIQDVVRSRGECDQQLVWTWTLCAQPDDGFV